MFVRNKIKLLDFVSLFYFFGVIGLIFLIFPVLTIIPMSFVNDKYLKFPPDQWSLKWYHNLFESAQWYEPLLRSLYIALFVTAISIFLGIISAYGLYYYRMRGKQLIIFLFLLPLFVPPVVLGVGYLLIFSKFGLVDTVLGVILSHILLAFPFSLLIFSSSFSRANMHLEDVACSLGASRFYSFVKVIQPQIRPGIIGAAIISFLVSFDEPIIVLFLTSANARTLPRQLFDSIRYDLDPTPAAISAIMIIISIFIGFLCTLRINIVKD